MCNLKLYQLLSVVADVLIEDDIKRLVAETVKKFGCIDILVNRRFKDFILI